MRRRTSRLQRTAAALAGCVLGASVLSVVPSAWSTSPGAGAAAAAVVRDTGTLVVALASSLSDVGTASSLVAAGEGDAVLFAESTDSLGSAASIAAARWQPERALIVGGTRAVSDNVEAELRRLSAGVRVIRLAGDDRIHTAALAADRVLVDKTPQAVIIANGWSLPDVGVAASAVASGAADAVLYASPDDLGEPTRSALQRHRPRLVLIAGGPAALAPQVQSDAQTAASAAESRRLGGATRVETAALVASDAIDAGATTLVVANGWSLQDVGLAAALAAALPDSAVVYTEGPATLGEATEQAIAGAQFSRMLLVGDETALGPALDPALTAALDPALTAAAGPALTAAAGPALTAAAGPALTAAAGPASTPALETQLAAAAAAGTASTLTRITSPVQTFYAATGITPPDRFTALSTGTQRTCGLRDDQAVICWSSDVTFADIVPPGRYATVPSSTIGPFFGHSCALDLDRAIACWGDNEHGQSDPPGGPFAAVAAGGRHTCTLAEDRAVVCWGSNEHGRSDPPEGTFTAIAAGHNHSCALRDDQTVTCWGLPENGRTDAPQGRFIEIGAGAAHSCGIREDRTIACWGHNFYKQTESPAGPHSGLSVGGWHSCALSEDRTASCWGNLSSWQIEVPAGPLAAVSAGSTHTCGLRENGTIECHGFGSWGWANTAPGDDGVAIQAVYAVPDGESPVSTRPEGISDSVKAAQAWFRSQTGGRHPVFERNGNTIDVKALRVGPAPTDPAQRNGRAMVAEVRATLGLSPYVPVLIFVEGNFGSPSSCGWKSDYFVVVPTGNCAFKPEPGARWPYGATYIIGHEVTHLLGATPACAPNHDGTSHVNDDNRDVIWLGPRARDWDNLMLDVGHDDYYMHGRDDCFDIADHPLLRTE